MVSHIGTVFASATSVTPTAHAVGDLMVACAHNFNSTALPGLPAGWTSLHTGNATHGRRIGYRYAAATNDGSGTWSNASELSVSVYRGANPGAATSAIGAIPALTLTGAPSWVMVSHVSETAPSLPEGCTTRSSGAYWRVSDTNGPVASWASQTGADMALVVELVDNTVTTGLDISRSAGGTVTTGLDVSRSALQYTVTAGLDVSRQASAFVTTGLDITRNALARGTWRDVTRSPAYLRAITARHRTVSAWGGLVDAQGNRVPVVIGRRTPSLALPLRKATVAMYGERPESWEATLEFSDRWMVPTRPDHPFWGLSNLRVRLYHRTLSDEGWLETVVCTVVPQDPDSVDADGLVSTTMQGADVLSTARGDYGAGLDVSGLTLDNAIRAIFERVAPTLNVKIAPTTVTAPDPCILGDRTPAQDWTDFAAAAWPQGVVRSDREGIVFAGPRPEPGDPVDWQQVPSRFKRALNTSAMGNRVTVVSTHPDATGLHVTVMDDNPASPTSVQAWGEHPLQSIETDLVTSEAGLLNLANMRLGKGLHPTEDVELLVPQRFDLDYQRPALVARDSLGIGGVHRISSWGPVDLPIGTDAPARMPVLLMQRTVR